MPQGSKASYSSKQKRQAGHIERSAKRRGKSQKTAERIAWATVNKRTGGAKGRKKRSASSRTSSKRPSRKRSTSRSTSRGKSRSASHGRSRGRSRKSSRSSSKSR